MNENVLLSLFISPEPKAPDELIGWDASQCLDVHPSLPPLSNKIISDTSRPIVIKSYLEHHWGRGLFVLGFGSDRIRTMVSMATGSSNRAIKGIIL